MRKRFCFGCHQEVRERKQADDGHKYCLDCFAKVQTKLRQIWRVEGDIAICTRCEGRNPSYTAQKDDKVSQQQHERFVHGFKQEGVA